MALKKEPTKPSDTPRRRRTRKTAAENTEAINTASQVEGVDYTEAKEDTEEVKEELKNSLHAATKEEIKEEHKQADADEIKALKAQVEALRGQLAEQQSKPAQIIHVEKDTERVLFLWQAEVSDDNTVTFGDNGRYGKIVGKTGSFYVPKNDLSSVLDAQTRHFIDNRWLIIVSGLDEEEREALGANYKEGEILDKKAFARMLDIGEKMIDIYPNLCDAHKEMVAKRYYEVWASGKGKLNREVVVALNKISPSEGFKAIIEEMNAKDAE